MKLNTSLMQLTLLATIGLYSQFSLAYIESFEGKTSCHILKKGKLVKKAPCSYGGFINSRDMSMQHEFDIKGYGTISTAMLREDTGNDADMEYYFTLNDKPAISIERNKNLKIFTRLNGKDYSNDNLLSCVQQKGGALEICTAEKDIDLTGL